MADDSDLTGATINAGRAIFRLAAVLAGKAGEAIATAQAAATQPATDQPGATPPFTIRPRASTPGTAPSGTAQHGASQPRTEPPGSAGDGSLIDQALRAATDDQLVNELARRLAATQ